MLRDEWLSAAMADDLVVVELLVRLKQAQAASPLKSPLPVTVPFRWGIRQPRSRIAMASRCDVVLQRSKDVDSTRCSPTTPLSWSGGASPSADGYEESSRPENPPQVASRFKGGAANESTTTTSGAKRLRRKKVRTFSELKEEESMLLKEKFHLQKELATLQASFEEQRAKNENLKKMKMDFELKRTQTLSRDPNGPEETSAMETHQMESLNLDTVPPELPLAGSDPCEAHKFDSTEDSVFFIPDLNMTPSASEN